VQTAAAFNRSYRIITVDPAFVTVSTPLRSSDIILNVNELNNSFNVKVFPNPARDKITVECPQNAHVEILTLEGLMIQRVTAYENQTTLDLSALSSGLYMIKVTTDKGNAISKFVKQ